MPNPSPKKDSIIPSGSLNHESSKELQTILMVGDTLVGKTALANRLAETIPSIAERQQPSQQNIDLFDIQGGYSAFSDVGIPLIRKAGTVIFVYDVTDQSSFDHIRDWLRLVQDTKESGQLYILAGTKMDLTQERVVSTKQAKDFADEFKMVHVETSRLDPQLKEKFEPLISDKETLKKLDEFEPTLRDIKSKMDAFIIELEKYQKDLYNKYYKKVEPPKDSDSAKQKSVTFEKIAKIHEEKVNEKDPKWRDAVNKIMATQNLLHALKDIQNKIDHNINQNPGQISLTARKALLTENQSFPDKINNEFERVSAVLKGPEEKSDATKKGVKGKFMEILNKKSIKTWLAEYENYIQDRKKNPDQQSLFFLPHDKSTTKLKEAKNAALEDELKHEAKQGAAAKEGGGPRRI